MKVSIMDFNGKKEPQCGLHVRVRFASKADIRAAIRHVRFTPESGHVQRTSLCLLWANSGHSR
jgi:hypothetical protein